MPLVRAAWFTAGLVALGLGLVGVVLPLLPTVPFMLLAAVCFARSSDAMHDWLVDHPAFGPAIRDWRANGAISRRGKRAAFLAMGAAFGLSLALGVPAHLLALQGAVLACVALFIWSRPLPS